MTRAPDAARFRWLVLAVFVLSSAINYLDRQALATLAPMVRAEFHLSNAQYGWILAAFSITYAASAPCAGMLIERGGRTVVYTADTRPTTALWREARKRNVRAVLAEVSFPDAQRDFALLVGHLTPRLLQDELAKLAMPEVPVFVYHLKPEHGDRIRRELAPLGARVSALEQDRTYEF